MSTYSDDIADRMSLESDGIAEALNSLDLASESFGKMDLVSWTLGNYAYDQDKKVYIDADESNRWLSARQARETVRQIVAGFIKEGLQPGDTVCIYAFNDFMYSMLLLGAIGAGGRFTGCNPAYTASELKHHMKITNTRFLLTDSKLLQKLIATTDNLGVPDWNIFVLDYFQQRPFSSKYKAVHDLLMRGQMDWIRFENEGQAKSSTAILLSTSGTTGLPKAAMHSHYSLIMLSYLLADSKDKPYEVSRLISLPMFHMYAFPLAHIAPLREGIPTYIMPRFDLSRYLAMIDKFGISETPMVPAMMKTILKSSSDEPVSLKSLRLVWSAGTVLDFHTQESIYRLLDPVARVVQVWGMTEAGYITTFLYPESDDTDPESGHTVSVGRLLPGVEAKLVTEHKNIINKDNVPGEIFIKGPLLMQGYLGNQVASDNAMDSDGWLRTGDIGYTVLGKFYIKDRKKDIIKVRGWPVAPAELESECMLHSDVLDCAIVGITVVNTTDEAPRAYIVKRAGSELDATEIKTFMSKNLAKHKTVDMGVVFTDSIPRGSTGKVLRNILKERAQQEVNAEFKGAFTKDPGVSAISRPAEDERLALESAAEQEELAKLTRAMDELTGIDPEGRIRLLAGGQTSGVASGVLRSNEAESDSDEYFSVEE